MSDFWEGLQESKPTGGSDFWEGLGSTPHVEVNFDYNPEEEQRAAKVRAAGPDELLRIHEQNQADEAKAAGESGSVVYRNLSPYVRAGLEGAGATLGATLGAPTALISGPAGPIVGAGIGFAGGKSLADLLDKILGGAPAQSAAELAAGVPSDVATGAGYEMGAQVLGKAAGGAYRALKGLLMGNLEEQAGRELVKATTPGVQYAKNAAEAAQVEKEIGQRFTRGEARNDPRAIMAERALARQGEAAGAVAEHRAAINETLKKYFGRNFSDGEIDQVINFLQTEQDKLGQAVTQRGAEATAAAQAARGQGPQEAGQSIVRALKSGRASAKAQAQSLYDKVGDVPVDVSQLSEDVYGIATPKSQFEAPENVPDILGRIKDYFRKAAMTQKLGERAELLDSIKSLGGITPNPGKGGMGAGIYDGFDESFAEGPKYLIRRSGLAPDDLKEALNNIGYDFGSTSEMYDAVRNAYRVSQDIKAGLYDLGGEIGQMSFTDLRGLRTTVLNEMRNEAAAGLPNAPKMQRLRDLKQSIETAIDQIGKGEGETAGAYRKASKFYREEYAQKFKQGPVADVLRPGFRGEETRIPPGEIAGKFFKAGKLDAADQFISAVGGNAEAKQAIRDYAADDLLRSATDSQTGELSTAGLNRWLGKNRPVLEKFGLQNEFSTLQKAQAALDEARGAVQGFSKSSAAKILGAEPEKAIETAFTGQRSPAKVAADLLFQLRGDKGARAGLQNAFADFLVRKMETTQADIAGQSVLSVASSKKLVQKYAGAMRILYSDRPEKLKALLTIQKAVEIGGRSARSPLGGGSDTAENVLNAIGNVVKDKAMDTFATTRALRAVRGVFASYNEAQVRKYLARALVDPDYAQSLINLAQGFTAEKAQVPRLMSGLGGSLAALGSGLEMQAAH